MAKYQRIHKKKSRPTKIPTKKLLIKRAQKLFEQTKEKQAVKEAAAKIRNTAIRFDLIDPPEVSFVIAIKNGKLKFITARMNAKLAIGMRKEFFLKLIKNPPKTGNMKTQLFDNVFLRRGPVREFKRLKSTITGLLLK